ncbi:MAG: N-acetylmuramoyl-L-alanine amidase [Gammaproteobacteria bacterium]|nr:N-acetylmuramoyl-L-alanine amidase [Gammaproteobacteria bacterium]
MLQLTKIDTDYWEIYWVLHPKSSNTSYVVRLIIALSAIFAVLPTCVFAESFQVENIRVAKNGQVTRVVFDTNAVPSYKIFTLNNPRRVVIDLVDAKLSAKVNQAVFKASFVDKLRHANRSNNKLRIVLDINQQIVTKSFVLPPNGNSRHRLVIDLKNSQQTNTLIAKKTSTRAAKDIVKTTTTKKTKIAKTTNKKPKVTASNNSKHVEKIVKPKPTKKTYPKSEQDIIAKVTAPAKVTTKTNQAKKVTPATKKYRPSTFVVAIDPGHGGKDPGATGYAGTREKDVVLQISKRLAKLINAEKGMRAVMTRNSDKFLTLRGRIKKARQQKADVFISIHADAVDDRRVRGSSVYILSKNGASSEAARFLAQRQNESDVIGGVKLEGKGKDVQKVLVDLSQAATIDASMKLASSVKKELSTLGKTRKNVEHAGFAVLKSPDIPSILVETAFISNASEEKKLRSSTHQQKLASSVFKGLKRYLKYHAPKDAVLASNIKTDKHTIKYGETLSEIAILYRVSIDAIRKTNSLRSDRIRVGQKLIIPEV